MASREHQTYFSYQEGYDETILRLGNLAFDFANPREKSPYIHDNIKDILEWTTADQRPVCSLAAEEGRNCSFGFGLQDILRFDAAKSRISYHVVVGTNGSKVELRQPEEFFRSTILQSPRAVHWLESRLTIISKLELHFKKASFRLPKIWLLTGLYTMNDAFFLTISKQSGVFSVDASAPIPDPTGLAALLGLSVGGKLQLQSGSTITSGAKILGQRVWAAQWQLVDVKYVSAETWRSKGYVNGLRLKSKLSLVDKTGGDEKQWSQVAVIPDMQLPRASLTKSHSELRDEGEGPVAVMELFEADLTGGEDSEDELSSEEYWHQFERELQCLKEGSMNY